MANFPASIPTIPDGGTWTHAQVAREIEAIATELGTDPSGAQTTVASRFTVVEGRVTAVEGATTTAGVEVASAQLTASYDIFGQAGGNTVWADTGLQIAVPAQTRAYNVTMAGTVSVQTGASFVGPKFLAVVLRIVDSGVTQDLDSSQVPVILVNSGVTSLFAKAFLLGRVPAGRAATTWKLQAKISSPDANVTAAALYGGTALPTPTTGAVPAHPIQLQAITV